MITDQTNKHDKMGRPPKYSYSDLEAVQQLHDTYKWGCLRISRKLGIPRQSVSNLLRILRTKSDGNLRPPDNKNTDIEHVKTIIYDDLLSPKLYNILIQDRIKQLEFARNLINDELKRLKRYQLQDIAISPKAINTIENTNI